MDKNQKDNRKENQIKDEVEESGEDSTKYGEFISSYFAWITPKRQKQKAEELENITKSKENDRK